MVSLLKLHVIMVAIIVLALIAEAVTCSHVGCFHIGENIKIKCPVPQHQVDELTSPTVRWSKGDQNKVIAEKLSGQDDVHVYESYKYQIGDVMDIIIHAAVIEDEGVYTCTLTFYNGEGWEGTVQGTIKLIACELPALDGTDENTRHIQSGTQHNSYIYLIIISLAVVVIVVVIGLIVRCGMVREHWYSVKSSAYYLGGNREDLSPVNKNKQ